MPENWLITLKNLALVISLGEKNQENYAENLTPIAVEGGFKQRKLGSLTDKLGIKAPFPPLFPSLTSKLFQQTLSKSVKLMLMVSVS